jgi:Secretion system C-terminal sorting domain
VTTMNPRSAGYIPPPYNPYITKSSDGGTSFEDWQHLDGGDWLAGSLIIQPMPTPCVASDGVFHAIYPSYVFSQNIYPQYIMASSADGGDSFTYQTVFSGTANPIDSLAKKGYLLRANPSNPEHLAFFYPFAPNDDGDIIMRETINAGTNWSEEIRVNDDPLGNGVLQDLVWADFDTDGDLVVTWRDRRSALDTGYQVSSEIWGAVRMNGDNSFGPNFPISSELVEHGQILNTSGNDFMCVEMVDDTISVVWGDVRTGLLKIWFQRLNSEGEVLSLIELAQTEEESFSVFPNPCYDRLNLDVKSYDSYKIVDSKGNEVLKGNTKEKIIDISTLSPGLYVIEVLFDGKKETAEFVKQ